MAISFPHAKKLKKHNGFHSADRITRIYPSPVCFYKLKEKNNSTVKSLVNVGDRVLRGQKIADIDSFNAVPIISSVSGTVLSVTDEMISIENDMLFDKIQPQFANLDSKSLSKEEYLWILRECGVCEVRTGIPLHVLLSSKKLPQYIILCCFDSDPYVSSPQGACIGNVPRILRTLELLMDITDVKHAIIAVENDMRRIFSDFKYRLRYNDDISLYSLKARYPQSDDNILVKTVTGKNIDNIDIILLSPETILNAELALKKSIPVMKKIVTVSGDDIIEPHNYNVPIGTTISSLLDISGYPSPRVVINGGIVDGEEIHDLDLPITPITKAILAFDDEKNIPKYRNSIK